ncbi:MAG: hypothetical protein ABSE87_00235 [Terracidiphilus sp.]|jgi:hypothetical protein
MKSADVSPEDHEVLPSSANGKDEKRRAVLLELEKILTSPFFRSAARSKQFLDYVVKHQLEGHPELLKERTIGTEVFLRPAGYATGDDPVVRVQAGEVRRRLEQYYQAGPSDSKVRIELPVGSYSPAFHWASAAPAIEAPHSHPPLPSPEPEPQPRSGSHRAKWWTIGVACCVLALAAGAAFLVMHRTAQQKSVIEQFWSPVFATQQPVLICLSKPVVYRPTQEIYQRYTRTHPNTFQTEVERTNQPLPLNPDENIPWGELYIPSDYGVALGDAYAAVSLSAQLGKIGKLAQVRIGTNYSFEDLRNSPAVVVGAFNNKWTMQLTSNLHFAFVEEHEEFMIREESGQRRIWETRKGPRGETIEDFALVSRLLDSKTGQFTITVAGIGGAGTQAAGEFVSNPAYLEEGLRNAPSGWQTKNLEVVLETTVTDTVAGPPHAVAAYYW